jgi:hypothetical protein
MLTTFKIVVVVIVVVLVVCVVVEFFSNISYLGIYFFPLGYNNVFIKP